MKSPLQFNCAKKIFTFLLVIFFFTNLFAKESPVAKDVKKALSSYAGMSELKKRGFNIKSLDTAETMEDIYNTMLPYMIQNGVPLDNAISFYDKQTRQTYSFKQHYSVNFTDDFGKKEELLNKGYKEDEIFAYFSKGKDVYRAGKFEWQKAKKYPEVGQWMMPQFPPVNGEQFIYFWPAFWTEKFYPDYWEQAAKKEYIILDLRLNQNGSYHISQFFDYLDKVKYQGQVIIIMDASSTAGEDLYDYRMTTWSNGQEKPRTFRYVSIGENTIGYQNYGGEWKRFETENTIISGVRQNINQWKKYDEGVGIMPDVWAETSEDISKTVEKITGIKDFSKKIQFYQKFIDNLILQSNNNLYKFKIPECFRKIQDDIVFLESISRFLELQSKWYAFCLENNDKKTIIQNTALYALSEKEDKLSLDEYFYELHKAINDSIPKNLTEIKELDKYNEQLISKIKNGDKTPFLIEKETIYSILKEYYVGFYTMLDHGFTKESWEAVSNYDDMKKLFDKCINDSHLTISNANGFSYRQNQIFDKDSIQSSDSFKTYKQIKTTNTYYIRYNSCDSNWNEYASFPEKAREACKYDYIVLDFRSNLGGGNFEQTQFFENLCKNNYRGTIYITQDNWSYSAGEMWIIANKYLDQLNIKLIGTHSGGMQIYGNCVTYKKNGISFYLPSRSFATQLPPNYLGEGKGYEPDIWANKNDMKSILESFGLDLNNIEFN